MATAERFTLSKEQLDQYFDRIALPQSRRLFEVSTLGDEAKLAFLSLLIKHQIIRVPFENLTQHYSWHRVIDVKPLHLFRKVVGQPGRGGYCMELNSLFHVVILSLGFRCYTAPARVWKSSKDGWTGWSHLVNLVTIGDDRYLCDVGFGPNEPIAPMPLNHQQIMPHVAPAETRLVYETLPQQLSDCKVWILQLRTDSEAGWIPMYSFAELEVMPTDIEGLNYAPWLSRTVHFTQKVTCVRFTTYTEVGGQGMANEEEIERGDIDGALIIDQDRIKWRRHGKNQLDTELKSEDERVDALRRYWGIDLDEEDREAIQGTVSALPSSQ